MTKKKQATAPSYWSAKITETVDVFHRGLGENFYTMHTKDASSFGTYSGSQVPTISKFVNQGIRQMSNTSALCLTFETDLPKTAAWFIEWDILTDIVKLRVTVDRVSCINTYTQFDCSASAKHPNVMVNVWHAVEATMATMESAYHRYFRAPRCISRYRDAVLVRGLDSFARLPDLASKTAVYSYATKINLATLSNDVILDILVNNFNGKSCPSSVYHSDLPAFILDVEGAKSIGQFCKIMRKKLADNAVFSWQKAW